MKKQYIFWGVLILSSFLFTNCQDKVMQGWEKVMAVHDEIMPITMKFPPMKEELTALANNEANAEQAENIKAHISDIQEAYNAMYKWMEDANGIKKELQEMEKEAALKQLVDEAARINQVKVSTNSAFENATKLLEELEK